MAKSSDGFSVRLRLRRKRIRIFRNPAISLHAGRLAQSACRGGTHDRAVHGANYRSRYASAEPHSGKHEYRSELHNPALPPAMIRRDYSDVAAGVFCGAAFRAARFFAAPFLAACFFSAAWRSSAQRLRLASIMALRPAALSLRLVLPGRAAVVAAVVPPADFFFASAHRLRCAAAIRLRALALIFLLGWRPGWPAL